MSQQEETNRVEIRWNLRVPLIITDYSRLMSVGHFDFQDFFPPPSGNVRKKVPTPQLMPTNQCPQKMSASFRTREMNVRSFWKSFIIIVLLIMSEWESKEHGGYTKIHSSLLRSAEHLGHPRPLLHAVVLQPKGALCHVLSKDDDSIENANHKT